MKRKPCVEQHDEKDCGPACLAAISQYYGKHVSLPHVREMTKTDADGTNLYGLVEGAKRLNFDAEALGGTYEEMLEGIADGEVSLPCITHIVTKEYLQHFIVIYAIKKSEVLIADPAKGKLKVKHKALEDQWTGHVINLKPNSCFERGRFTPSPFLFFRNLIGRHKFLVLQILICTILLAAFSIATAFVFQVVIDNILGMVNIYDYRNLIRSLTMVCLATAGLYIVAALIRIVRGYYLAHFSKKLDVEIVLHCYEHAIDLPFSFFGTRKTGEILSRFSDAQAIQDMLSSATFSVVVDGLMVIFGAVILWLISPALSIVAFTIAAIYLILIMSHKRKIRRINQTEMENSSQTTAYFKESIDGIETIKALNMEKGVKKKTRILFNRLISTSFKQSIMYNNLSAIIGVTTSVGTVVMLWLGVQGVLGGVLTLGELITFNTLLNYFLTPLENLIGLQPQLQAAGVATNRLNDILLAEKEDIESGIIANELSGNIKYENICFRYGNRELALDSICLEIKKGESVAIIGESGSGKSTLMKLLMRLYEPEDGTISINGINTCTINRAHLRDCVVYLTQDIFLFSDTIEKNILYGCDSEEVGDDEFRRICGLCKVADFVDKLPFGYDTRLEENGVNLSGGQRQRIALARALLRKPDILILDEAMSSLDSITEHALSNMIFNIDAKMTRIVIAHRLSTIVQCDKIIIMDQGQIVECGAHNELMGRSEKYRSFWVGKKE